MNITFFILFGIMKGVTFNDDPVYYARMTNTWSYLGNDRITVTEHWFSKEKSCSVVNNINKTIIRKDKGLQYSVNLRTGSVQSRPLMQEIMTGRTEKKEDIKYVGQNYTPIFEWNTPVLLAKEKSAGYDCDHFICIGDADFARISLDFLIAETKDQFIADYINSFMVNIPESNKREPLALMVKNNGLIFPLKIIEDVENAIAPHILTTIVIDKLEKVIPSEDLFEPPVNK
jgi:hypothetical protein